MQELEDWLYSRVGLNFRPGLHRMRAMMDYFHHPETACPVIHVTGTNGKGSTIAFMSQLLEDQGLTVGSFTSPHMERMNERIRINRTPIPDASMMDLAQEIKKAETATDYQLSFFEILTVMALLYFRQTQPQVVLLEVGIGGLLDTTNVVPSEFALITSIGLDHQETLGDTIEAIAHQKAGIFKPGSQALVGPLPQKALEVCRQQAPDVLVYGEDFAIREGFFENARMRFPIPQIGLRGDYQVENAGLALQTVLLFMEKHGLSTNQERFSSSLASTQWWGRLEEISPGILLDGAHNLAALERLVAYLRREGMDQVTIVFGALRRKDYQAMLSYLKASLPQARILVVGFDDSGSLREAVEGFPFEADFRRALAQEKTPMVVTGSLYFIAQARAYLAKG